MIKVNNKDIRTIDHISHLVLIVNFEQVNAGLVNSNNTCRYLWYNYIAFFSNQIKNDL